MNGSNSRQFWTGVIAGLVVALIVNYLITIGGAFIGGIVTGVIVRGGAKNGGKAGVYLGLLNAVVLAAAIFVYGIETAPPDISYLGFLGSTLFIVVALFPLFGLFGYVGGLIGGSLTK
ncbi:hypothetical protein E2N92_11795 [Methanofollis formosanus]|uniref:DUF5518 domain-containing protein n=1 Tax=Methanofollis formosanus TaxID=299308 RepID=A0A8G1A2A1_9EURY|nr:DUF5518 domain-containing protein [Methanofollis formosanus]QYZ80059.1 hypothetical protein E2N92_11795 [Methanofollis formosanus]